MGLNKRRHKFMKLRRTMKAQSPKKKKEKERNNKEKRRGSQSEDMQQGSQARPEDMHQGSRPGQKTCSKDLGQARGYAARRINIKALCMFRFPTKKAIKNPAQSSERTGLGYLVARDPRDVQHSVGLRQLKRSTTKYNKRRTDMFFLSTQWCSKELESLESDNS